MNILVCSKYGKFCGQLIRRLRKEKHEIYLLTGSPQSGAQNMPGVFQAYRFSYQNENITRIMQNISPDVMIILGAQDPHFSWRDAQNQSVEYISGMTNLLVAAKTAGVPRVIYCSSLGIFEGNREEEITESTKPAPISLKMKAFLQIETLCEQYREPGSFEISAIRFPEIYGELDEYGAAQDICALLMDRLQNAEDALLYEKGKMHSLLYLDDAVEVVLRVLAHEQQRELYQVMGVCYSEQEIAQALLDLSGRQLPLTEREATAWQFPLKVQATQEELLGFQIRYPLKTGLARLWEAYQKIQKKRQGEKKGSAFRRTLISLLEVTVVFALVLALSAFFAPTWVGGAIDLYLIYAVLIGVTYGVSYALYACVLCSAAKVIFLLQNISQFGASMDYSLFLSILQLVVVAVMAGFMRDKYRRMREDLKDENTYLQKELSDITRINDSNLYVKDIYEKRLVNYRNSLAKIYDIVSQMDFMEPRRVVFQATRVAQQIMETEHVAIYIASRKSSFFRLAASSSKKATQMGKSLRFDQELFCYQRLYDHEIYMSREVNAQRPTFVGATYSEEDARIETILMVWADDLSQVSLYQSNLMALLCRLIEKSMNRAALYEQSIYEDTYLEGSRVLRPRAFTEVVRTYQEGARMGLLEYTLLQIEGQDPQSHARVEGLVRDTDYIGQHDGRLYVLLSNSNREEAKFVMHRMKENELAVRLAESQMIVGPENE